jgi:hypothetical protein
VAELAAGHGHVAHSPHEQGKPGNREPVAQPGGGVEGWKPSVAGLGIAKHAVVPPGHATAVKDDGG